MCSVVKDAVAHHAACCFSHFAERSPVFEFLTSFECRQLGCPQVSWCFTPSQPVRLYQGDGCPQRLSPRLKSKLLSCLMGTRKDSNKTNKTPRTCAMTVWSLPLIKMVRGRSALSSSEKGRFIHVSYYYHYYYKSLSVPHGCFLKGVVTWFSVKTFS